MKNLILFLILIPTTASTSWISLDEDGNLYTEKKITKRSLPKIDWKQWQHGPKQGLSIAKQKYRSAMRHQSFSAPGMHRPKVIKTIDAPTYYKSATYFYSKQTINDARSNPQFLQWRRRQ